ncbi:MAG: FHA domain-containing protein [Microlunatus sp.]|nr:FHA domain-containing protein [Microlunatus sp.]
MTRRRAAGMTMRVQADLQLDVTPGNEENRTGFGARIESDSDVVRVSLDRVPVLAGRPSSSLLRGVSDTLASTGLQVVVEGPDGRLVSAGAGVRTPWWQRLFVRTSHVRVHDLRAGLRVLTRPRTPDEATSVPPPAVLFSPPATLLPLTPTMLGRQRVSTTHDPAGGGQPRLYFPPVDTAGSRPRVFHLRPEISIGDRVDADLRLSGVSTEQATIYRDAADEYVIAPRPGALPVRVHGERIFGPALLRTGARIEIGSWRMVYFRAEYADHGRPYGGRQGGELDNQQWQPPARYRPEIREGGSPEHPPG